MSRGAMSIAFDLLTSRFTDHNWVAVTVTLTSAMHAAAYCGGVHSRVQFFWEMDRGTYYFYMLEKKRRRMTPDGNRRA